MVIGREKVLIVDDNPDFVFSMETFLNRNGLDTLSAGDGQSVLELVQKERPDLVLLDVMMESVYSGLEVCRRLRTDPELKSIPIIGISGIGRDLEVKLDRWGDEEYFPVDEYFEKPVDRYELLERIRIRLERGVIDRKS